MATEVKQGTVRRFHDIMQDVAVRKLHEAEEAETGAVGSLDGMVEGYQKFLKEQAEEKRAWQRVFTTWAQATMEKAEKRAMQTEGETAEVERHGERHGEEKGKHKCTQVEENPDVMLEILLQHKQRVLDEVPTTDEMWQVQAESWARRCTICRVRDGRRRTHDWRDCDIYPSDREAIRKVHGEVQTGTLSIENAANVSGICGLCTRTRQFCWMQIKHSAAKKGCRCSAVMTESWATILAIGPQMVREWEEREGGPRGKLEREAGQAQQRFGCRAIRRGWQVFGWVGIWDIRRAKVDTLIEEYKEQMRRSAAGGIGALQERRRLYGVWGGLIGRKDAEACGEKVVEEVGEESGGEYIEIIDEER